MSNDPLIELLKKEFQQKKARNTAYSLRSYSRDLALDPSNLHKIMNYQKSIGPTLRQRIGKKLGFEKSEILNLLKPASSSKTEDKDYQQHRLEVF